MNELKIFDNQEFGKVRIIKDKENFLFCATDVATALGYINPRDAIRRHCKGVVKRDTLTEGGTQQISFISEGDVYRLIVHSKLPAAEKFERWVFEEVLPSIRKTGAYATKPMTDYQKSVIEARNRKNSLEAAKLLNEIAADYEGEYRHILQAHATKELTGNFILPLPEMPERTYTAEEIGNQLGITANMVGRIANEHGLKTSEYGKWFVDKSRYSNKEVRTFRYFENAVQCIADILEN